MAGPKVIELGLGRQAVRIPILYENRSVLAIDKPAGWMLVPFSWQRTHRNLHAAITSSIAARDFWARSRNLKFLRHVHRLDAETTGILLLARSPGALHTLADLFERRDMHKRYLAVVHGSPARPAWTRSDPLAPDPREIGRQRVDPRGKPAETAFQVLATRERSALVEARPVTGRTHQIRLHLLASGHPVVGDELYGPPAGEPRCERFPLALRAVQLSYRDPFTHRPVDIAAPETDFLQAFEFARPTAASKGGSGP